MDTDLIDLFNYNKQWAAAVESDNPGHFERSAKAQQPDYLWIGCADSRVPPNTITGLQPGELFVHRNVANQVYLTDTNCMSVVEYAAHALQVKHLIVCGHYGCGGVLATLAGGTEGAVDQWLEGLRDLAANHSDELDGLDEVAAGRRLCELNVMQQADALRQSDVIRRVWRSGRPFAIHAWIYEQANGLLSTLQAPITSPASRR